MDNILLILFALMLVIVWYSIHRIVYKKGNILINRIYFIVSSSLLFIVMLNCIKIMF